MKLFRLDYDSQGDYVEATNMAEAIIVWHAHMKVQNGDDWTGDEEPDGCALIDDKPVLRRLE